MDIIQVFILSLGFLAALGLLAAALAGPSTRKQLQRRLSGVRTRHTDDANARVESQMKKALAARKPKVQKTAGGGSRTEALALRLQATGMGWTIKQYVYASLGLAAVFGLITLLQTGVPLLSAIAGLLIGAGLPHMVVSFFMKRRTAQFNARFPDAIDLLVRGLRSGLPVTETLAVVAQEIPGPVGIEFKGIIERIKIGRSMEEAMQESADRLGIAEFNSRDPARNRRQPCRNALQPFRRVAQARADEAEDQGDEL